MRDQPDERKEATVGIAGVHSETRTVKKWIQKDGSRWIPKTISDDIKTDSDGAACTSPSDPPEQQNEAANEPGKKQRNRKRPQKKRSR